MSRPCIAMGLIIACTLAVVRADQVEMTTGDVLQGRILEHTTDYLLLDHPVLGRLKIPATRLKNVTFQPQIPLIPTEPAATASAATGGPATQATAATAPTTFPATQAIEPMVFRSVNLLNWLFHPLIADGWRSHLEIGFTGTQGVSDTLALRTVFHTEMKTEEDRWKIDSSYYLSESRNQTTRNEFAGLVIKDWLVPEHPWFYFAQGKYEYNEFSDWRQRISAAGGLGYDWIKSPQFDLTTRTGLGAKREFGNTEHDIKPEGSLGVELVWRLSPRQKFAAAATYYPELIEIDRSRVVSSADWTFLLDQVERVSLKLGIQDEYESQTRDDSAHNNAKFFGALVFDF